MAAYQTTLTLSSTGHGCERILPRDTDQISLLLLARSLHEICTRVLAVNRTIDTSQEVEPAGVAQSRSKNDLSASELDLYSNGDWRNEAVCLKESPELFFLQLNNRLNRLRQFAADAPCGKHVLLLVRVLV